MRRFLLFTAVLLLPSGASADPPRYRVSIEDGPTSRAQSLYRVLSSSTGPHLVINTHGGFNFGLQHGPHLLTSGQNHGFQLALRKNGKVLNLGAGGDITNVKPLKTGRRVGNIFHGQSYTKRLSDLEIKQTVEIVPGHPLQPMPKGHALHEDTCLTSYEITNRADEEAVIEPRVTIISRLVFNPRPQFVSPRSPEKLLDGVALESLPPYLLCLEKPNVKEPGKTGVLTLRFEDRRIGPSKAVLTNTSALTFNWDIVPSSVAMFGGYVESAAVFYWAPRTLAPGQKVTFALGYGMGKAETPQTAGMMDLHLTGNFEPGKTFTVAAHVSDPLNGQTLRLELPDGVRLTEGKETQPLAIADIGPAFTLWKASVERPGEYPIRVHSSHGLVLTKVLKVSD